MIVRSTIEIVPKIAVSDLSDPPIPMAIFQVIQFGFMVIGFLFKNDVPVGPIVVLVFKKVDKVVEKI